MNQFFEKFRKIKKSVPQRRGLQFERLFYEIFDYHNILLEKSFKNEDGSQQIDGAIEIKNRIILIEAKWERSETLAASKLYSFLGKINSKIEGTIGLFISYNELSDNFVNSARGGIKQNCIIINGKNNIIPLIKSEIPIAEYIWYIYQQASTKNRITVPVSEFKSIPLGLNGHKGADKWKEVYEALISDESDGDFQVKFEEHYGSIDKLPEKVIILYPILRKKGIDKNKINYLVEAIIDKDPRSFFNSLISKLQTNNWIEYAEEYILGKTKNLSKMPKEQADKIADKVLIYLREHFGQWEEENQASLVMDFLFENLSEELRNKTLCAYSKIYCDSSRRSHYPQKKFADKIFKKISRKDRWEAIKDEVTDLIQQYKENEKIFSDDTEERNKKYVIRRIEQEFWKIIEYEDSDKIATQLNKMYDQA